MPQSSRMMVTFWARCCQRAVSDTGALWKANAAATAIAASDSFRNVRFFMANSDLFYPRLLRPAEWARAGFKTVLLRRGPGGILCENTVMTIRVMGVCMAAVLSAGAAEPEKILWEGTSGGYAIRWTTADLTARKGAASFSLKP